MKANKLLKRMKTVNKSFYTVNDIEIITGESRDSVRVLLSRLVKRGLLQRLLRNIYVLPDQLIDWEKLAQQIDSTSYLSFESALYRYGILNQIPYVITLVTARKSKQYKFGEQTIVFRKTQPKFYNNYLLVDNLRVATPEKALLDIIYLNSLGKLTFNFEELDFSLIDKKKCLKMTQAYSDKVQRIVGALLIKN